MADLSRSLELEPDDAFALAHRGGTYLRLGRCHEALADLSRSLELDPDDAVVLRNRGETYNRLGRHDQALADLDRVLSVDPNDAVALRIRGHICVSLNAIEALADLIVLCSLNLTMHSLGLCADQSMGYGVTFSKPWPI
jgi:regulator of sirC expression with transglutaminase-like and TPR domain